MQEVADVLTWKQISDTPALWRTRYEDLLESRIQSLMVVKDEDIRCILESLAMLPRDRQRAFLRAPQVASRLLAPKQHDELDSGPVARSLLAELATAGIVSELSDPLWTVLGDRHLDPESPATWREPVAGILGTHIVLDGAGPIDFSCGATGYLVLHADDERIDVERKLIDAARAVAFSSGSAFRFWTDCLDVVAIRKTAQSLTPCSSNSFVRNARLTLIINGHLPTVGSASVADVIVHEAIHSLLFMYEEIESPFVPRNTQAELLKIRSPWSGKELFLSAYVHACVTWYGLYWFWNVAAKAEAWPAQYCNYFRARAEAGFDHLPFSKLSDNWQFLSPAVAALLIEIERRMS
jgi:hypothetical protein